MRTRLTMPAIFAVGLGACGDGDELVEGTRMTPSASYAVWWAETETCLGVSRPFGEISWWKAERLIVAGEKAFAVFRYPDEIFIRSDVLNCEPVVKHESVHAILMEVAENSESQGECGTLDWWNFAGCPEQ